MNEMAQISTRQDIQKICPYLTFKSSNLETWSTFAL